MKEGRKEASKKEGKDKKKIIKEGRKNEATKKERKDQKKIKKEGT